MSQKLNFGQVNLLASAGYSGPHGAFMNVMATGDLNQDGYDDIVVGLFLEDRITGKTPAQAEVKPVVLFYNPQTGTYTTNKAVQDQLSVNVHPRQALIGDFNGDGKNDLFIGDHGLDGLSRGYQNTLLLGTGSGFKNATGLLPQVVDYSHGAVVEDFNRDGVDDILVLNSPVLKLDGTNTNRSYVLTKSADAKFVQTTFNLADATDFNFVDTAIQDVRTRPLYHVGATGDFNKDGVPDLVVGGDHRMMIFESNGLGSYKDAVPIGVSQAYVQQYAGVDAKNMITNTPYSYIVPYDINGDGVDEIVATYLRQDPYTGRWEGRQFQVVQRDKNGAWNDITNSVFGTQTFDQKQAGVWTYKISVVDVNADGKKDLVLSNFSATNSGNNNVWLFQDGKFVQSADWLQYRGYQQFQSASLNGSDYLLGFQYNFNTSTIEIAGWKTPEPPKKVEPITTTTVTTTNTAETTTADTDNRGNDTFRLIDPPSNLSKSKVLSYWSGEIYNEDTVVKVYADFADRYTEPQPNELEITYIGVPIYPEG